MSHCAQLAGFSVVVLSEIALVACFTAFVGMVIWVWRRPRGDVQRWARMPIEDDSQDDRRP